MKVEDLIKRYEEAKKNGSNRTRKGISEKIRKYILKKMGNNKYVPLKDIVKGLIEDGTATQLGLEPKYNIVYNRVRQTVTTSKKAGLALGMTEDETVVIVKL